VSSRAGVFIVRNICKTCVRYFPCSFTLYLFISPGEITTCPWRTWNSSYLYRSAKWPRAMSVILAFSVAFETAFHQHSLHGIVSPLTNLFLSVTGNRRQGFGRRRYGRLFLAISGFFVIISSWDANWHFAVYVSKLNRYWRILQTGRQQPSDRYLTISPDLQISVAIWFQIWILNSWKRIQIRIEMKTLWMIFAGAVVSTLLSDTKSSSRKENLEEEKRQ